MSREEKRDEERPAEDEPLNLVPAEDEPPRPRPVPEEEQSGEDSPILLVPFEGELSTEIPPLEPLPEEPAEDLEPMFPVPVSPFGDLTLPPAQPPPGEDRDRALQKDTPEEEEEEPTKPPSLYPLDLPGLTYWLIGDLNTFIWLGATAVLAIVLFGGFLLSGVPMLGPPVQVLLGVIAVYFVAAYPHDILRAALAGRPGLPDWPDYGRDAQGPMNAAICLLILAVCLGPGLLAGFLLGRFFGLPLLLIGWTVFPAALLLFAARGSIFTVNPLRFVDAVIASGWRYILATLPGYVVLIARVLAEGSFSAPFILSLLLPAMLAAALVVGTLAREDRRLGRTVLAIARLTSRVNAQREHREEE